MAFTLRCCSSSSLSPSSGLLAGRGGCYRTRARRVSMAFASRRCRDAGQPLEAPLVPAGTGKWPSGGHLEDDLRPAVFSPFSLFASVAGRILIRRRVELEMRHDRSKNAPKSNAILPLFHQLVGALRVLGTNTPTTPITRVAERAGTSHDRLALHITRGSSRHDVTRAAMGESPTGEAPFGTGDRGAPSPCEAGLHGGPRGWATLGVHGSSATRGRGRDLCRAVSRPPYRFAPVAQLDRAAAF
jgi:hypothetical protein